jgi:hypothetical protein
MERRRFDDLTRAVAAPATRRGVLTGLGTLVGGLLGGRAVPADAQSCPPDQVHRRGVGCVCRTTGRPPVGGLCPCAGRLRRCGDVCVDLSRDDAHCGSCGSACQAPSRCQGGACTCTATADPCAAVPGGCGIAGDGCGGRVDCGLCQVSFTTPGSTSSWDVPAGTTAAAFSVTGAAGAAGFGSISPPGGSGGFGGQVTATLAVTPGESLTLTVGAVGGGAPGGTDGLSGFYNGGAGGGASGVARGGAFLLVAGGGGGGGGADPIYSGGAGGAGHGGAPATGGAGSHSSNGGGGGGGGTASSGGDGGAMGVPGEDGSTGEFGAGGAGGDANLGSGGGGGGGGYYGGGGGGGGQGGGGGGGGAGFVVGGATNVAQSSGVNVGDGSIIVTYIPDLS